MSTIYVIDIILLVILYLLIMFMCGYSVYCVYRLLRSMQMRILLRPTRVVFSHKKDGESTEELRTVVAYQNPFTGDYCVHKSHLGQGYENSMAESPDSGLSDAYEPLNLEPARVHVPNGLDQVVHTYKIKTIRDHGIHPPTEDWIQCHACEEWCHEKCADMGGKKGPYKM